MKVLLVNKFFYKRGGDCIHTIGLKELLESKGHSVSVFSMRYPKNQSNDFSSYWPSEVNFNIKKPMGVIKTFTRPFYSREVIGCFKKLIQDFQPDIVHLHNIHTQISPVVAKVAYDFKIPVIWTMHDYKLLCPAYTFVDNKGETCEDCLEHSYSVLLKRCIKGSLIGSAIGFCEKHRWDTDVLTKIVDSFISPSKFMRSKMISGGFDANRIFHLGHFLSHPDIKREVSKTRVNKIIFVGRLSKEKGVRTLCKAFQDVKGLELLIIGDGPMKEILELKYSSEKIKFLGYQKWEFIKEELSKALFAIVPSEWYEVYGLTIQEALYLGTPVLGAKIGAIPELIDGNNGMLFESGNAQQLAEGIEKMRAKKDWNYEDISNNAKRDFSKEQYYSKLMELYKKFI